MAENKKRKSWSELSGGEKKATLLGWAAGAAVLVWLILPGSKEQPHEPAPALDSPAATPAAKYQAASPEALVSAKAFVAQLDNAMLNGADILQAGDLAKVSQHSRDISALVASGRTQFGSSVFEPLGYCFSSGVQAQSWWLAQIDATSKGGVESVPGTIKSALKEYQTHRTACLESADPVAAAKADAELKEQTGGGRECLTSFTVDPQTKEVVAKPKPAHCKTNKEANG